MVGGSRTRRLGAFRSLAGNRALVRVVGGYVLFTLAQYSVWVAMLVYAYRQGGAAVAGLVALARLASAAVTTTRPAQSTLIQSVSVTPDQPTAANVAISWLAVRAFHRVLPERIATTTRIPR